MFDELREMLDFIMLAPWFIFGGFAGSFLLTFTVVKLAHSHIIHDWITKKTNRARKQIPKKRRRQ